jgi:SAM-dependent methyltransferase
MITKSTQNSGQAAWRTLSTLLPLAYESATRPWLQKYLPKSGRQGLHLSCGNGVETFLIASILGDKYSLIGIEKDAILIESARQIKSSLNLKHIYFIQDNIDSEEHDLSVDFVYTRLQIAELYKQNGPIKVIGQSLKLDGVLLIEMMQWSGFHAYPYHHAFVRATELLGRLEDPLPDQAQLSSWLPGIGCAIIDTAYASPVFIPRNCNQIISLALQWQREEIMNRLGLSQEEINALLQELWQFEQQEDTLISRSGVRQIFAKKII